MNPHAKRLLAVRSGAVAQVCSNLHQLVTIDAQLDALALDDADDIAVREIRENQDTCMADAVVDATQICTEARG